MNGATRLAEEDIFLLQKRCMYEYLSVIRCSHTTGLTMVKSVDLLKRFVAICPLLERTRWVSKYLSPCPFVARGLHGGYNCMSQRVETPNLAEFEH